MKHKIEKYFVKQLKAFEKNFKKSKKKFNIHAIHKMRLSIKRTKALFLFFEYIHPDHFNSKKEFNSIKKLFKLAGNIRDIQVQIKIIKKNQKDLNHKFKDYINYLEDKEGEAIEIFNQKVHDSLHQQVEFNQGKIRDILQKLSNEDYIREKTVSLLNEKITYIDELRKDLSKEKNIHEIRITIKQIHYLFTFTKRYISKNLFLHLSKKKLKKIENIFGDWHDRVNGLNHLQAFLDQKPPDNQRKYQLLKKKLELDKNILFLQIKHIIRKELLFFFVLEL